MEHTPNITMLFIYAVISFFIFLSVMKILKFLWKKIIYKIIVFFRPELKNLYDFFNWIGSFFKPKK